MAVEERVVIKVEVDADITNDLLAIERRIKALEDRSKNFNKQTKDTDKNMQRMSRRFGKLDNVIKKVSSTLLKFVTTLGKFSFIALAGQVVLFTTALLGVKAALWSGRVAVKIYDAALKGLAVTAATVATALSVAAAAMRQFNEAQMGAHYGGGRAGLQAAAGMSRGLGTRNAGLLGGEAAKAIASTLSRGGLRGNQSGLVSQLFNITGGDAKAAMTMASALTGTDVNAAISAVKGSAGFRKGSLDNKSFGSVGALRSFVGGGSATGEGFANLGSEMASTFVGTLKTEFSGLKNVFGDLGEPLMAPFRDAFLEISRILKNDIMGMSAMLQKFGAKSMAPTLITAIEKFSGFIRTEIMDNLPNIEQMGESFVGFFASIRDFFRGIGEGLNKMEPAANVVIDMFRAMGSSAGGRGLFSSFRNLVVSNADAFKDFGSSIGNVIGSIFDMLSAGQSGFFAKMPVFSEILNTIANKVIPAFANIFGRMMPIFESLPKILTGLADVLNFIAPIIGGLATAIKGLVNILPAAMSTMMLMGGSAFLPGGGAIKRGGKSLIGKGGKQLAGTGLFGRMKSAGSSLKGKWANGMGKNAMGGPMVGMMGAGIAFGGIMGSYEDGGGTGNLLAGAGGGAMLGMAVGGPVGAVVGGLVGGVASWFMGKKGREKIKRLTGEAMDKHSLALQNMTVGAFGRGIGADTENKNALDTQVNIMRAAMRSGSARKHSADSRTMRRANQQLAHGWISQDQFDMIAGETIGKDTEEFDAVTKMLQEIGVLGEKFDKTQVWEDLPNLLEQAEEKLQEVNRAIENYTTNTEELGEIFDMSADDVDRLAVALKINLKDALNEIGRDLMFFSHIWAMDRNQGFLPNLSGSMMGRAELRTTARADFNTLRNADELTTDMIGQFISSFAAYESAVGLSPDLAAISGIYELEQKMHTFSPTKQAQLQGVINTAYSDTFGQMAMEYGGDAGMYRGVYTNAGGGQAGLTALDETLANRQHLMNVMSGSGGLSAIDRVTAMNQYYAGGDIGESQAFQDALMDQFGRIGAETGNYSGSQIFGRQIAEGTFDAAAAIEMITSSPQYYGGFDTDELLSTFISAEAPLDVERNSMLGTINASIRDLNIGNSGDDTERGPTDGDGSGGYTFRPMKMR